MADRDQMPNREACPCGSGGAFGDCCGPIIGGQVPCETARALMCSRYTAYVTGASDYLRASWHPGTRHRHRYREVGEPVKWLGLKILSVHAGGPDDREGQVEFVARFKVGGRARRLHEISRFRRHDGRWHYVDGEPGPTDSGFAHGAGDADR